MLKNIRSYIQNSDTILGIGLIFVLVLIIIPLPGYLLDGLITISLLSAILIILVSLSTQSPADFSVFPTLLLLTTIYRLALNVATTRMILTEGSGSTSKMIEVFGTFVVGGGGNAGGYVIGIIIFLILTLVQILVITKGATRVSEVAARFALDSLPGKQLAIDSDLAAGHIDEAQARKRREALQTEMGFYGAMDGASKFVQGDVRFGLVMIVVNIVGGLIVGVSIRGESLSDAVAIYTRFTIGDGLVSALPALLISTATGIIVSRSVGDEALPADLRRQLFSNPQILYVVGAILTLAGLIPGFPFFAMASIGGLIIFIGSRINRNLQRQKSDQRKGEDRERERHPESYLQHLRTDPLELELGYSLVPLVQSKAGSVLLEQISRLRRRFAIESGLIVPPVRIRDNMNLDPGEYVIKLQGSVIGGAKIEPNKLMAIDTGRVTRELEGEVIEEPTYQLKAIWIDPQNKSDAESYGYDVVDPSTVIATNLSNIILQNSSEIMGRREIKSIMDSVREDNQVVVDEVLTEKKVGLGQIQTILQNLLKEGVSIRNMGMILETIADHADKTQRDPYLLTEAVRYSLRRQIVGDYLAENKKLFCIPLQNSIERHLREGIHRDPEEGFVMALRPDFQAALRDVLLVQYHKANNEKRHPIFLCSRAVRGGVFYILERLVPARSFAVLAHEEIPSDIKVELAGEVSLESRSEPAKSEPIKNEPARTVNS